MCNLHPPFFRHPVCYVYTVNTFCKAGPVVIIFIALLIFLTINSSKALYCNTKCSSKAKINFCLQWLVSRLTIRFVNPATEQNSQDQQTDGFHSFSAKIIRFMLSRREPGTTLSHPQSLIANKNFTKVSIMKT